ncbi:MAG: acyl-CoA reductase [Saprospiraceae bacterium]|nr:MAG: acyl-CoA reductase [Saprospiraceae bacterium]
MELMTLEDRIQVMKRLGEILSEKNEYLEAVMQRSQFNNGWFTLENQQRSIRAIADQFLQENALRKWLSNYKITEPFSPKAIGMVLAGNLPLVGFHDLLCVFLAGHKSLIKLSEKDQYLLPALLKFLQEIDSRTVHYFEVVEQLKGFEAVIATGSNNSSRYFDAYFGKYPNIIRRNRNALAVLSGQENHEELLALGRDIFTYYGLGCRNVSKIYVPKGYAFEPFLEAMHEYREVVLNTKYKNNFDYNYAMLILNRVEYMGNGCLLLTENQSLQSPIAGLHYEYYQEPQQLEMELKKRESEIQCIVGREGVLSLPVLPFGKAQEPELWDYADGVDTLEFLLSL